MSRVMELAGDIEDSNSLIEGHSPSKPESRLRWILAVGAVLLAGAAVCAMLLGGTGAASASVVAKLGTEVVRADAESGVVEMCGVDYKIEEVLHNNLGGQGPGTGLEGMTFRCSESINHEYKRDIIVEMNAVTPYQSQSSHLNGIAHDFAAIHVDAGSEVKLLVHFKDMLDGKPIELNTFRMTFYDMEEQPDHLSQKYIIADNHPATLRDQHSEVLRKKVDGGVEFEATGIGSGADNPIDSSELSREQQDKSVVLTYHDIKQFHVTLGLETGQQPRAFEFALHSALSCHKVKIARTSTGTGTTTTTANPMIAALARQREANLMKAVAAVGVVAAIAACVFLALCTKKWLAARRMTRLHRFDGSS